MTKIKYAVFVECISPPAGIPFATARNVKIKRGRFTLRVHRGTLLKHGTEGSSTSVVVTGKFLAHHRASGTIAEHDVFEQCRKVKPIRCHGSTRWTAKT